MGGYVGLFLGYAIVQIPVLIKCIFEWSKRIATRRTAIGSRKISPPSHCTTQNANKDIEKSAREDTLLTVKRDIKKIFYQ